MNETVKVRFHGANDAEAEPARQSQDYSLRALSKKRNDPVIGDPLVLLPRNSLRGTLLLKRGTLSEIISCKNDPISYRAVLIEETIRKESVSL